MKKLILTFFFLTGVFFCNAQTTPFKTHYLKKSIIAAPYYGSVMYKTVNQSVEIGP